MALPRQPGDIYSWHSSMLFDAGPYINVSENQYKNQARRQSPENICEVPERAGLQQARLFLLVLRHSEVDSAQLPKIQIRIPEHCPLGAGQTKAFPGRKAAPSSRNLATFIPVRMVARGAPGVDPGAP